MHQDPLVSIITPSYNSEQYIETTIKSVQEQIYRNWEMIIVDDCSTDDSLSIIRQYAKQDARIEIIENQKNMGAARSRNKAIKAAKGDYIAFLDSDDVWLPHKLTKQISFMQTKQILLSYSSYNLIDALGNQTGTFHAPETCTYKDMLKTSCMGTLTTIYNAKKLGKFYFIDVGHEDYAYKLAILKKTSYAQGIDTPLANYRISSESLSRNKLKAAQWQWYIYRRVEKLSMLRSLFYFTHYAYHGVFKYTK